MTDLLVKFELLKLWMDRWIDFYFCQDQIKYTGFHYNGKFMQGISSFDQLINRIQ